MQFFWGSFDLNVARYSGKSAEPPKTGGRIMRYAEDAQNIAAGFWPGGKGINTPAFYSYSHPEPSASSWRTRVPPPGIDETLAESSCRMRMCAKPPSPAGDSRVLESSVRGPGETGGLGYAVLHAPRPGWPAERDRHFRVGVRRRFVGLSRECRPSPSAMVALAPAAVALGSAAGERHRYPAGAVSSRKRMCHLERSTKEGRADASRHRRQLREVERRAEAEYGRSSPMLMEHAGRSIAEALREHGGDRSPI